MVGSASEQPTRVPFMDLARTNDPIRPELERALATVTGEEDFILGAELTGFEREFAAYIGAEQASAVNRVPPPLRSRSRRPASVRGDEVIVPAHTYVASALAICAAGARAGVRATSTAANGAGRPCGVPRSVIPGARPRSCRAPLRPGLRHGRGRRGRCSHGLARDRGRRPGARRRCDGRRAGLRARRRRSASIRARTWAPSATAG